jgi:hypothetical protein
MCCGLLLRCCGVDSNVCKGEGVVLLSKCHAQIQQAYSAGSSALKGWQCQCFIGMLRGVAACMRWLYTLRGV